MRKLRPIRLCLALAALLASAGWPAAADHYAAHRGRNTREILLRRSPLVRGKWLFYIVTCICMSVSVIYEFIEWWTALIAGGGAIEFLGTQGDPWDTQSDMFCALIGAVVALLVLSRRHERQLSELPPG